MKEWIEEQFTKERMIRYLDGCNPNRGYGYLSHVQQIMWQDPKRLWGVVNVTTPERKRNVYYFNAYFCQSQHHFAAIELVMWTGGRKRQKGTVVVHFNEKENAPKKLNKAIRQLRAELGL